MVTTAMIREISRAVLALKPIEISPIETVRSRDTPLPRVMYLNTCLLDYDSNEVIEDMMKLLALKRKSKNSNNA